MKNHDEKSENPVITETRVRVRQKGQVTLPREVRERLHIEEGDEISFVTTEDGVVTVRGYTAIPADQRWFWTPEWQAGEREADEQIAAGGGRVYHDIDEMLDDLDRRFPPK
ncbi:AbrB/MazE/SpoVT family DNA-binding domain-containing protein [Glycomyces halotolerans]